MNQLHKIRARLDPDVCGVGGERFWAIPTGRPDEYRGANPLGAAPFGLGDIVRVGHPGPGELPQVVAIVSRSSRVTLRLDVIPPDLAEDPLAEAELSLAGAAVERARDLGADVERLYLGSLAVRLPEGVGVTGDADLDCDAWVQWLRPASPAALREADPLLPAFWLLVDDVCGPHHTGEGLVAEFEEPLPVWEGPVPDFAAEHGFVAAHERADLPAWFSVDMAVSAATYSYCSNDVVRRALECGYALVFDDLVTESFNQVCLANDLPLLPVDREMWDFV